VKNELPVMFVTEDTTRATPENIKALYQTAVRCGARRVTIADTVGHAVPSGVKALVCYVREVTEATGEEVLIDWHGHNDRGLATINALTAAFSGADQIHGTALGIGERCGNAAMDQMLVNLKLMGCVDNDLTRLQDYCDTASRALGVDIPVNYPMVGPDAFRTATGVHAAAVIKAGRFGDQWIEDMIYSGVPASMIGREQVIEIGPMSGMANVTHWLASRGYEPEPHLVDRIFKAAKEAKTVLNENEILRVIKEVGAESGRGRNR
jgi:2-isopropylmalate synthase